MPQTDSLNGKKVLVVEDEYFIVQELADWLLDSGTEVVGPAATVDAALALVQKCDIDAAILDINLGGEMAFPVADALLEGGIPFLFSTGYDNSVIPQRFGAIPRFFKPADNGLFCDALFPQAAVTGETVQG